MRNLLSFLNWRWLISQITICGVNRISENCEIANWFQEFSSEALAKILRITPLALEERPSETTSELSEGVCHQFSPVMPPLLTGTCFLLFRVTHRLFTSLELLYASYFVYTAHVDAQYNEIAVAPNSKSVYTTKNRSSGYTRPNLRQLPTKIVVSQAHNSCGTFHSFMVK